MTHLVLSKEPFIARCIYSSHETVPREEAFVYTLRRVSHFAKHSQRTQAHLVIDTMLAIISYVRETDPYLFWKVDPYLAIIFEADPYLRFEADAYL